jgi:hypothetical protein
MYYFGRVLGHDGVIHHETTACGSRESAAELARAWVDERPAYRVQSMTSPCPLGMD